MEEQINVPTPQPQVPQSEVMAPVESQKSGKIWMIIAIVAIIALIVVSAFGYYKWQQYRTKVGNLGAEINALKSMVSEHEEKLSDKNVVLNMAKASCESQKDPTTNKNYTFVIGTVGTSKQDVEFSDNKESARLIASCQQGSTTVPGSSKTYVFKKLDGSWALVITTASPISKATGQSYDLPAAWFQASTTTPTT